MEFLADLRPVEYSEGPKRFFMKSVTFQLSNAVSQYFSPIYPPPFGDFFGFQRGGDLERLHFSFTDPKTRGRRIWTEILWFEIFIRPLEKRQKRFFLKKGAKRQGNHRFHWRVSSFGLSIPSKNEIFAFYWFSSGRVCVKHLPTNFRSNLEF